MKLVDTLLGKVADIVEKDFLFASLVPSLLFVLAVALTLRRAALGAEDVVGAVAAWVSPQNIPAAVAALIGLIVFAYIVNALRTTFTRFWSGSFGALDPFGLLRRFGEAWQTAVYVRLREKANTMPPWGKVLEDFAKEVETTIGRAEGANRLFVKAKLVPPGLSALPNIGERSKLESLVHDLKASWNPETKERLDSLILAHAKYRKEDLARFYLEVRQKLEDWHEKAQIDNQTAAYDLDRRFGGVGTIRATALGNVIESYSQYPAKRYLIEAEIFWPRLQAVMKPEYLSLVQEPLTLMNFWLTVASLSGIYGLLALLVGPWLWLEAQSWLLAAALGFAVAGLCYRLGIAAAYQHGELVRSSFDLYRLDLMQALDQAVPPDYKAEREQWEEFSKLVVYGDPQVNFNLEPPKGAS